MGDVPEETKAAIAALFVIAFLIFTPLGPAVAVIFGIGFFLLALVIIGVVKSVRNVSTPQPKSYSISEHDAMTVIHGYFESDSTWVKGVPWTVEKYDGDSGLLVASVSIVSSKGQPLWIWAKFQVTPSESQTLVTQEWRHRFNGFDWWELVDIIERVQKKIGRMLSDSSTPRSRP